VLDDGIRGFGSATEKNAEAAGVAPSPSDATHGQSPHNFGVWGQGMDSLRDWVNEENEQ
jgi:hypothetical protein